MKSIFYIIVVSCFLVQLILYCIFYLRVSTHKNNQDKKTQEKISLIICARNEKENLEQHLEFFKTRFQRL